MCISAPGLKKCKNLIFCSKITFSAKYCKISQRCHFCTLRANGEKWLPTFLQLRSKIRRVRIGNFIENSQISDFLWFCKKAFYKFHGFLKILQKQPCLAVCAKPQENKGQIDAFLVHNRKIHTFGIFLLFLHFLAFLRLKHFLTRKVVFGWKINFCAKNAPLENAGSPIPLNQNRLLGATGP